MLCRMSELRGLPIIPLGSPTHKRGKTSAGVRWQTDLKAEWLVGNRPLRTRRAIKMARAESQTYFNHFP